MDKIEEFVTEYYLKNKARNESRRILRGYFKTISADPNTYFRKKQKHDYGADVMSYFKTIADLSPPTRRTYISYVKVYLEDNNVFLRPGVWKRITRIGEGNRPRTIDRCPTNKEMRQILSHGGATERGLFMVISSSGMRMGEAIKLIPSNIDMDSDPVRVDLPGSITKNGNPRITFISNEAKVALTEWLKERDEYLVASVRKSVGLGIDRIDDLDNERVFPFSYSTGRRMWIRLLQKSGMDARDENTKLKFHKLHEHVLRKFFETNMITAGVPEAIVQRLTGHEGYLGGIYKKFSDVALADFYKKGVNSLLIFETGEDSGRLNTIEQQLERQERENEMLKREMNTIRREMLQQQEFLGDMREWLKKKAI